MASFRYFSFKPREARIVSFYNARLTLHVNRREIIPKWIPEGKFSNFEVIVKEIVNCTHNIKFLVREMVKKVVLTFGVWMRTKMIMGPQ